MKLVLAALVLVALLSACGGTPPPPDWKMNAFNQLEQTQQYWLQGDSKSAALALFKMRGEIAKTGRLELLARAELAACAAHVASLDFSACTAFDRLAPDASNSDNAYARFLAADWAGLDAKLLPAHYDSLLAARDDASANRAAAEIKDPLPRLIAAAVLFRSGRVQPATLGMAVDTASERGWRRPLLAWLEVLHKRAQASGDTDAARLLQRRIELVLGQPKAP